MDKTFEKENRIYDEDEISLYEQWLKIKKRKKLILSLFFVSVILATILAFTMTPIYRSTAAIMPISTSSSTPTPSANLPGIAVIAGLSSLGESDEVKKVMAILNSRTIKENVIKKLNLIPVLFEKIPEDRNPMNAALEKFSKNIQISKEGGTGVILISYYDKDPELAAKIVTAYIEEAKRILNEKAFTVAKMNRIFLENQLKQQEEKLNKLREKLTNFQKKTKLIRPDLQVGSSVSLYSRLISEKVKLQIELKKLQLALSSSNPKVELLKKQIKAIDRQLKTIEEKSHSAIPSLKNAPEKMSEYLKLVNDIKAQEEIYKTILQAYERAKFEETKNNLFIQIIDKAFIPDKPEKPNKKLIVSLAGISSLFVGVFLAFILDAYERRKKYYG